jgi:hypothetical protein
MLEIALGILGSNGFSGARHGVQQIVCGAGLGPFEKLFEFRPGLLDGVEFRGIGRQEDIPDSMALEEGLDPSRAMDRMVIENQGLARAVGRNSVLAYSAECVELRLCGGIRRSTAYSALRGLFSIGQAERQGIAVVNIRNEGSPSRT